MVIAKLEKNENTAKLYLKTHFNIEHEFLFEKKSDEVFRLSGTAVNEVLSYEGLILDLNSRKFRAFTSNDQYIEGFGVLSPEIWDHSDRHAYITEYYPLDMENKSHSWFISKNPIKDANHLFINIDVLDGGENLIKRYRISPFTGEYLVG